MPLLFSVPNCEYQAAPFEDDGGDVGVGFYVIEQRGLVPQTGLRRERRSRSRLAAAAFEGRHEGGLFAADKSAGAHADVEVEVETGAEDVRSEQPVLSRLFDGVGEALDRERILGAYVDVAVLEPTA